MLNPEALSSISAGIFEAKPGKLDIYLKKSNLTFYFSVFKIMYFVLIYQDFHSDLIKGEIDNNFQVKEQQYS